MRYPKNLTNRLDPYKRFRLKKDGKIILSFSSVVRPEKQIEKLQDYLDKAPDGLYCIECSLLNNKFTAAETIEIPIGKQLGDNTQTIIVNNPAPLNEKPPFDLTEYAQLKVDNAVLRAENARLLERLNDLADDLDDAEEAAQPLNDKPQLQDILSDLLINHGSALIDKLLNPKPAQIPQPVAALPLIQDAPTVRKPLVRGSQEYFDWLYNLQDAATFEKEITYLSQNQDKGTNKEVYAKILGDLENAQQNDTPDYQEPYGV